MKTLFTELFRTNTCFAVCVSLDTVKLESVDIFNREYFVLIHKDDKHRISNFYFSQCEKPYTDLLERNINAAEILDFKSNMNMFEKIIHNKDGRAYELIGNSFKEYYGLLKGQSVKV